MNLRYEEERIRLYQGDARHMTDIPDGSIHLIVTSPPYLNGRDYAQWDSYDAYLDDMYRVWLECQRVLVDTGRICINIPPDYGYGNKRKHFFLDMSDQLRKLFNFWGPIVWEKGGTGTSATAWGSWRSSSSPNFRGRFELILVASKGDRKRAHKGVSDLTSEEFTEFSQNVWRFAPVSGKRRWHPAPFPATLPYRCIKMLSYVGDTVLDPFAGSCTTLYVARSIGRTGVGIELKEEYIEKAAQVLRDGELGTQLKKEAAQLGYTQESLLERETEHGEEEPQGNPGEPVPA